MTKKKFGHADNPTILTDLPISKYRYSISFYVRLLISDICLKYIIKCVYP